MGIHPIKTHPSHTWQRGKMIFPRNEIYYLELELRRQEEIMLNLEREVLTSMQCLQHAVNWWLSEGMKDQIGAPGWVFEARNILEKKPCTPTEE